MLNYYCKLSTASPLTVSYAGLKNEFWSWSFIKKLSLIRNFLGKKEKNFNATNIINIKSKKKYCRFSQAVWWWW